MKQFMSLLWKEWHESQAYLWIGLGVFLGFPVIGGLEESINSVRSFQIVVTPWVLAFASLLAIFTAVGTTCRDLTSRTEEFWRSQPISVPRWMLIKYFMGLATAVTACAIPMSIQQWLGYEKEITILPFVFICMVPYSVGFLAGCVVRRTAHSTMLALAAMLILFMIPVIFPPLNWLDTTGKTGVQSTLLQWLGFEIGIGFSLVVLYIAITCVQHGWQIESGPKMMYGSIAAALLLLFSSAAFQLGTNLPILQLINLSRDERVGSIVSVAAKVFVTTGKSDEYWKHPTLDKDPDSYTTRPVAVTEAGFDLGKPISDDDPVFMRWIRSQEGVDQNNVSYYVHDESDKIDPSYLTENLSMVGITSRGPGKQMKLWAGQYREMFVRPELSVWQNQLYVMGSHLVILDINKPYDPRILSDQTGDFSAHVVDLSGSKKLNISWRPVPGLPPEERLNACMKYRMRGDSIFQDNTLCFSNGKAIYSYRLVSLTDSGAGFEELGHYDPSILETFFNGRGGFYVRLESEKNGLLYVRNEQNTALVNASVTVFEIAGKHPMRNVGHFAAPGVSRVFPLPDGRAIVGGGNKLWLVGPPPGFSGN